MEVTPEFFHNPSVQRNLVLKTGLKVQSSPIHTARYNVRTPLLSYFSPHDLYTYEGSLLKRPAHLRNWGGYISMQSLQDLIGTFPWPPWELRLVNNTALKG